MEILSNRSIHIFRIVEFIIYCLKAVGLAPFSICIITSVKYFQNTYTWAIKFSKVGLCYNILITILFPTIAAFCFRHILSIDYLNKSSLTLTTDIVQVLLVIITSSVILIFWTFNEKKASNIINRLLNVHGKLSSTTMPPSSRKPLMFLFIHIIINAIQWIYLWTSSSFRNGGAFLPIQIFSSLPSLIICWYLIEYSMIVGLLTAQLNSINRNLSRFKHVLDFHLEASNNSSIYSQLVALNSFQNFRAGLYETSQEISDFFSIPVLLCFAYSFSALVFDVYYLIIPLVAPHGVFTFTFSFIIMNWIVIIVYPVTSLLISVTENVNEARLTGRIVHKLLLHSTNKEINAKLQQFSLQLLHENFNYTACGFFTLDLTLLHAMLGSMATYLVILIQFQ